MAKVQVARQELHTIDRFALPSPRYPSPAGVEDHRDDDGLGDQRRPQRWPEQPLQQQQRPEWMDLRIVGAHADMMALYG